MNQPQAADIFYYLLILLLPLSALIARRLPLGQAVRMTLGWIGIFAVLLFVITAGKRLGVTPKMLAENLGLSDQSVTGHSVSIPKAPDGHFYATVTIGGVSRRLLVDSGATVTMISLPLAKAAGIDPGADPFGTIIQTANGPIIARRAVAEKLAIGPIEARNLDILVDEHFDDDGVVGMNFLSSLKSWRVEGDRMILEPNDQ